MGCVYRRITAPGRPLRLPANRQLPATTARQGAGSMIRSGTAPIACFMAGTTLECAPAASAAQVDWLLGYPERGLALSRAALAWAERIAHPFSLLEALLFNAMAPP